MMRIPRPVRTSQGLTYNGRLLDRPAEPVVDQGAPFDIQTLISRRGILSVFGAGVGAAALGACTSGSSGRAASSAASSAGSIGASANALASTGSSTASSAASASAATVALSGEIPEETAGPFPGDGSNGVDVLVRSGVVRSDVRSSIGGGASADGVPMTLKLTIVDMANGNVPFKDVAVYIWHCDAQGRYSMYSSGVENETYLRGVQVAASNGVVTFTSIFPGCYSGRWPHIHFEVYPNVASITDSTKAIATSQVALPKDASVSVYTSSKYSGSTRNLSQVTLASDNVFGDDGGVRQIPSVTGDANSGYTVSLVVGVDTKTAPSRNSAPSGGGPNGGR